MDEATLRGILGAHGGLAAHVEALGVDDDLYAAGMTSHASVNVMIAIEDELDVTFPDEMLTKATFASVRSILEAVGLVLG